MPPPLLVGNFTASGLDLVNGAGFYVWCVAALAALVVCYVLVLFSVSLILDVAIRGVVELAGRL